MQLILYHNTAEPNRVDKSDHLTVVTAITGDEVELANDLLNPSFVIRSTTAPTANYARIPEYNRYYFITGVVWVGEKLWQLNLRVDPLHTYRTQIAALTGVIARQENNYNNLIPDPMLPAESRCNIDLIRNYSGTQFTPQSAADPAAYRYVVITSHSANAVAANVIIGG